jgi:acyl carrier protein
MPLAPEAVLERIRPIFRDVLDLPSFDVMPSDNASTVEGWDSLAHINLVTNIEQEFGIRFALGELAELKNVGEMIDLILKKLAQRP